MDDEKWQFYNGGSVGNYHHTIITYNDKIFYFGDNYYKRGHENWSKKNGFDPNLV